MKYCGIAENGFIGLLLPKASVRMCAQHILSDAGLGCLQPGKLKNIYSAKGCVANGASANG